MKLRIGAPWVTLGIWLLAWGGTTSSARAQVEAAGDHHTCAWFANEVKCWGWNNSGQLGQGDTVTHDESVKCWGRDNDGELGLGDTSSRGDAAGEMGDALPEVEL